jgi:aldehyde dehydrogenase (NAD+)
LIAAAAPIIARDAETWMQLCATPQRFDPVETLSAELLPLCSALRFIGRRGAKVLRTRRLSQRGRPLW